MFLWLGKKHQHSIWEELSNWFVSLAGLNSKYACDQLCMIIYGCCDENREFLTKLCIDNGWPMVADTLWIASSAGFGKDWFKLLLSRICLEKPQLPICCFIN